MMSGIAILLQAISLSILHAKILALVLEENERKTSKWICWQPKRLG